MGRLRRNLLVLLGLRYRDPLINIHSGEIWYLTHENTLRREELFFCFHLLTPFSPHLQTLKCI